MQLTRPLPAAGRPSAFAGPRSGLAAEFDAVRHRTRQLAEPLSAEDCQVQSMPDASPVKWHLAHVTWFFETLVLERFEPGFRPFHPAYRVLFNSYYNAVGAKHPRPQRGQITRPSLAEVLAWRAQVDERMGALLAGKVTPEMASLVLLGLQHEQQHQELLLTDVKHLLSCNPLHPVYRATWPLAAVAPAPASWLPYPGGEVAIGHAGDGFAFDNELPQHAQLLAPYALGNRLVTHGEWADFMADGGYRDPRWWLAAGWDWRCAQAVEAPLYWQRSGDGASGDDWHSFTLHGLVPIDRHTPITHVSYYEADAFARWKSAADPAFAGARLPTEAEWEAAVAPQAAALAACGNFVESGALHPMPVARSDGGLVQALGDVWEWTASSYSPYPGYRPWGGAVGEYNGKFMVNQTVLRGGSCATPVSHIRASYRNFFPTDARWQFSGVRLARDLA
ncbi:MAG: ergothioneine biosynthesis protein EgtB [Betaproteobacteria bacterium HGW-Betaproteobacteria-3]|jgi:ergothioneine biosynthesis protein EgtB|nr:MAG: ergothioneine biosynthesis protein EgtB [Betaproteobacteria bacterium HGW-Betaproteobacteria-3]